MSWRTVIEINHDAIQTLTTDPVKLKEFFIALTSSLSDAKRVAPQGLRVLGQRHHADPLYIEAQSGEVHHNRMPKPGSY